MTERPLRIHGSIRIGMRKRTSGTPGLAPRRAAAGLTVCLGPWPHQERAKIYRVLPHSQIWLERPLRRSLPLHLQDSSKPLSNPCSHLQSIVLHVPFVLFSCISEFWLERLTVNHIYNIIPLQSNCRKQTHLELSYKLKENLPDSTGPALQNAVFTYTRRCCTKRNQHCSVQN